MKEVCWRAVAHGDIGAGPHHRCRLIASVERCQPQGLCTTPPQGVAVIPDAEVFAGDGVIHAARQDTVRLCVQTGYLKRNTDPTGIVYF